MSRVLTPIVVLALLAAPAAAAAQGADNVLVVINDASQASIQIGEYYARARSIAQDHVVRLKTATTDAIAREEFQRTIEAPIARWLGQHNLQDRILYIVLTKGVPLRIPGTDGREGSVASVDSELTVMYRKLVGQQVSQLGHVANPYFLGTAPISDAKPFTRLTADTYLVTRLDGFTVDDVLKLIDRGVNPSKEGTFVLDQRASLMDRGGDQWLQEAADRIRIATSPDRVALETTRGLAPNPAGPVMGYYSWGSNDPANKLRKTGFQFANGAIGGLFVSTDGRTFAEPPADWVPGPSQRPLGTYGSGSQSIIGDLIRDGMTGVAAHVTEPYLDATVRPQVLFPAYLAGFNLAESFYLSMPYLSWQTIVVGDPLCTPFPRKTLTDNELHKGIDPETEVPALFAERRLALSAKTGFNLQALKLILKSEAYNVREDEANLEPLLVKATELEPRLVEAHLRLATMYEGRKDYAKAIERYRKMLAVDPSNAVVLNNLAFGLAEHMKQPKEALPLAEKAYKLAPHPVIGDTLAWIQHLLGDNKTAAVLIEKAVAGAPTHPDILIHAAAIHLELGDTARAKTELDAAEKATPSVKDRDDYKALRAKIK
jgi:uncharacterized protein (TIGR03790 family)